MNWADLLDALLTAGLILPVLLTVLRLLSTTKAMTIQVAELTLMTVSSRAARPTPPSCTPPRPLSWC